ncbi:MAG: phosphogluconate dehydratase [Polyangiales bacterium]
MKHTVELVTDRIRARSKERRSHYLSRVEAMTSRAAGVQRMGCANVAHALATVPERERLRVLNEKAPNIGIVTAFNDVLSAHHAYESYPAIIRDEAHKHGASAQVAGGVPAMCDGVTQGYPGMELSLFSRDTIAMSASVAMSHDVFDAAMYLGICDKIVPGLLIGALHFGHLPSVWVPAGPMSSGLSNSEKAKVREQHAQGLVGRDALMAAEMAAYHGVGTCTFYGTANSNQMLLEAMGLHVSSAAFVHPQDPRRELLTREAVRSVLAMRGDRAARLGVMVDERCIVNAMVALLATGGSTNHLIHWVAVARAAGIEIHWGDFDALSAVVPLVARVYPNGSADVNDFERAGGTAFVIDTLLDEGLLHGEVRTVNGDSLRSQCRKPTLDAAGALVFEPVRKQSADTAVLRRASEPFSPTGGLKLLEGNLGRSVIKVSAVPADRMVIEAPAIVFESQGALQRAFDKGELERDFVAVVRFQGPRANGMPELHKLTPTLSVLQSRGFKVALVTDGRMSGASGKIPAAIHMSPEALAGGALARVRDGDVIRLDALQGRLDALVDPAEFDARTPAVLSDAAREENEHGLGRELFVNFRRNVSSAEEGATSWGV